MINEIISAILQIIVFCFIPLLVYLIRNKRFKGFFDYIGLKSSNTKANLLSLLASVAIFVPILIMILINSDFKEIMLDPNSMTGKFRAMGFGAGSVILIIIAAVFKTALAEEILFRGFVAKRLITITNYKTGNLIQAVLFGIIHTLLFLSISKNPLFLIFIFVFPALGAYLMTYFNEIKAGGSIIPGWIAHATANLLSYTIIGFVI